MAKRRNGEDESAFQFEQALGELQQIVSELEEGAQGLEQSLASFEKGIALLRRCHQFLDQAELKIEILTGTDSAGNPVTRPFDATATFDPATELAGRSGCEAEPADGRQASL